MGTRINGAADDAKNRSRDRTAEVVHRSCATNDAHDFTLVRVLQFPECRHGLGNLVAVGPEATARRSEDEPVMHRDVNGEGPR